MNDILTEKFRDVITKLGLYDTGKLHDSIQVDVVPNGGLISVDVYAASHIQYLLGDYPIVSNFENSNTFKSEIERYKRIISGYYDSIDNSLLEGLFRVEVNLYY